MKLTSAIEIVGYGVTGNIGGLARTTYYTPDGRIIRTFPDIREYVQKKGGVVVGQGKRDANLDKGWLLSPPIVPKIFCATCDKWHDNQAEIKVCARKQKGLITQALTKANREKKDKTEELENKVAELTALVNKLMEGNNGALLQPTPNEQTQFTKQQNLRRTKTAVQ